MYGKSYILIFVCNQATLAEYEETVQKAREAWKVWADVSNKLMVTHTC